MEFSEKIRYLRIKNNLTQDELAKRTNLTQRRIADFENARHMPSGEELTTISSFFRINKESLISNKCDITMQSEEKMFKRKLFLLASMLALFNVGLVFIVLVLLDSTIVVGRTLKFATEQYISKYQIMYFLVPFTFFYLITVAHKFGSFDNKREKKVYFWEVLTIIMEIVFGITAIVVYFVNFSILSERYRQFIFGLIGLILLILGILVHPIVNKNGYYWGIKANWNQEERNLSNDANVVLSLALIVCSVVFMIANLFVDNSYLLLILTVPFALAFTYQQVVRKKKIVEFKKEND